MIFYIFNVLFLFIYSIIFNTSYLLSALFIYLLYFVQKDYVFNLRVDYKSEEKYIKIYLILNIIFVLYFIIMWLFSLYLVIKYKSILNRTKIFYIENGVKIYETKKLKRKLNIGLWKILFMSSLKYEKYEPVIILKNQMNDKIRLKTNSIISEKVIGIYLSKNLVFSLHNSNIDSSDFRNEITTDSNLISKDLI